MPVDEDFNLDSPEGITQEDIERMNEIADELEEIANSAEGNVQRINKASGVLKGKTFAELNILGGTPEDYDPNIQAGVSREEMYELIIEILAEQEKAKSERKENEEAIEEIKLTAEQQFQQTSSGIRGGIGEITALRGNPKAFGLGKLRNLFGKAGIYGAVANFAIEMAQSMYHQVLDEVKAQFKAGGAWDRRKLVEDEINEYNGIAYLTKIRSGQVFFNADAGSELRQGSPTGSNNTRSLRDGHLRFIQFHGGI